jgi:tetratricopeptide (TPR) repeat protein
MKQAAGVSTAMYLTVCAVVLAAMPSLSQEKPAQESKPAQGQQGQAPAGPQVSPQQVKDAQAIQNELDPDKQIKLVEDFVTKYPDSPYLSDMYFFGAYAAQQKGDIAKILDYGEKSLKAKDDNMRTLLLMASILPRPQVAQGADAEKRLSEAEADANKVLKMVPQLAKPPNQTDDQFQQAKSAVNAEAHSALGMVHLQRASQGLTGPDADELSKAEKEYQAAVSVPNPNAEDYFRLGETYKMHNKTDEAIEAFTKASQLSQGSPLQTYAEQNLKAMKEKKAQATPAPKQ